MSRKQGSQAVLQTLILSTFCCLLLPGCTQGTNTTNSSSIIVKPTPITSMNKSIPFKSRSTQGGNYSILSIEPGNTRNVSLISVHVHVTSTHISPSQTQQPTTPVTTVPVTTVPASKKGTGREFDGLSFFGGMILGATICVVLFFALKYYRAKKRSYHSL